MSQQVQIQTTCPVCELTYKYEACFSLTLGKPEDAALVKLLREGLLNSVPCLACATPLLLQIPLVLNAPQDESLVIYVPNSTELSDEEIEAVYMPFYQEFLASLPDEELEDYLAVPYLVEDLSMFLFIASAEYDEKPTSEQAALEGDVLYDHEQSPEVEILVEELSDGTFGIINPAPAITATDEIAAGLEGLDLTPQEQALLKDRLALLQQLFSLPDSATRRDLMATEHARIDQIFIELVEVLTEQAAEAEPEKHLPLVRIYNEAMEVIRAGEE